jgi:transcriptional regulator with XRE-family HTH domain
MNDWQRRIRKLDIKQKKMASYFNITESYLSSIMNGNRKPSHNLEQKIESYISKREVLSVFLSSDK